MLNKCDGLKGCGKNLAFQGQQNITMNKENILLQSVPNSAGQEKIKNF
jgi:hypothetical protein